MVRIPHIQGHLIVIVAKSIALFVRTQETPDSRTVDSTATRTAAKQEHLVQSAQIDEVVRDDRAEQAAGAIEDLIEVEIVVRVDQMSIVPRTHTERTDRYAYTGPMFLFLLEENRW